MQETKMFGLMHSPVLLIHSDSIDDIVARHGGHL
jgi:hypothetical protein